jgi:hypothetical protein
MITYLKFSIFRKIKSKYAIFTNFISKQYFYNRHNCRICNSNEYSIISNYDRYGSKYKLIFCNNCKQINSLTEIYESRINDYYNTIANIIKEKKSYEVLFIERTSKKSYSHDRFNYITSSIFEINKVFEFGCSDGANLYAFHLKNIPVQGFDYSSRIKIGEKHGMNLMQIDNSFNIESNFPIIMPNQILILSHLIEHIPDILTFFSILNSKFKINSYIFIETPSIDHILNNNSTTKNQLYSNDTDILNYLQLEHMNFFQTNFINTLLIYNGFEIIKFNDSYRCIAIKRKDIYFDRQNFLTTVTNNSKITLELIENHIINTYKNFPFYKKIIKYFI